MSESTWQRTGQRSPAETRTTRQCGLDASDRLRCACRFRFRRGDAVNGPPGVEFAFGEEERIAA